MGGWRRRLRTFKRNERGAAIVEFALVVPFFFLLVWGGLVFARAYQRLGVLKGALREGARVGATIEPLNIVNAQAIVRARVATYSTALGFPIDVNQVVVPLVTTDVNVSVTNYPLFADLTGFFNLNAITVSDTAIFRWERSP